MQCSCGTRMGAPCQLPASSRGSSMHVLQAKHVHLSNHRVNLRPRRSSPIPHAVLGIGDLPKQGTPLPASTQAATTIAQEARYTSSKQQPPAQTQPAYTAPPVDRWRDDPVLMSGCEGGAAPLHVAVLLSGGVDSSLALRLLVAAGHHCTAFYLQIWFQEDFRNFWDACPWEEDLKYAQQVCDSLGVPLEVVPMTKQYWEKVVSHSVEEIRAGRTPNPDMLCNSRVKFGAFLDHLDALEASGGPRYDRVASGHYARLSRHSSRDPQASGRYAGASTIAAQSAHTALAPSTTVTGLATATTGSAPDQMTGPAASTTTAQMTMATWPAAQSTPAATGPAAVTATELGTAAAVPTTAVGHVSVGAARQEEVLLVLTPDPIKDQTYFLAHLTTRQLSRTMFPLGGLTKPQVRALAAAAELATQARKDSQGICFLGKVKFPEFVKEHLGEWQGLIVEHEQWQQQPPETQQPSATPTSNSLPGASGANSTSSSVGGNEVGINNRDRNSRGEGSSKQGGGKVNKGGVAPTLALFGDHRVLGVHQGYWFYTVGQRGGIKLPGGPWYVTRKDCELNIVYVSRSYHEPGRQRNAFITGPFSWLSARRPNLEQGAAPLLCKVRHGPHAYQCELRPLPYQHLQVPHSNGVQASHSNDLGGAHSHDLGNSNSNGLQQSHSSGSHTVGAGSWDQGAVVVLDGSDQGLAAGQYAVFYQDGVCLGTAKIEGCVDVEQGYGGPEAHGTAGVLSALGLQFQEQ